jgi:hypothetical protein
MSQQSSGNSSPTPSTPAEKSVAFINAEVLDPPAQGSISFVGPFYQQTLVMALEDARSFLQGAEQILLIALAKALEKYLSGGAVVAADSEPNLKPIENMMGSLANFHATMAETAFKHRGH